ncbi:hypothetical protein SRHO_G00198980 [Serrasalmus rhombeus]
MTVQEALEVIIDHDSETEEGVSEDEDYLELNSDSSDSDFEPDEGIAIPIPPSKTFVSKNGVSSQKVLTQTPSVLTDQGRTVSLDCNIAKDEGYVYWYKQIPQAAPQFVLRFYHSHSSPDKYGDNFPSSRFTSKASSSIDYQLIISNVEVGDSAVYYCKTWDSSAKEWVSQ